MILKVVALTAADTVQAVRRFNRLNRLNLFSTQRTGVLGPHLPNERSPTKLWLLYVLAHRLCNRARSST